MTGEDEWQVRPERLRDLRVPSDPRRCAPGAARPSGRRRAGPRCVAPRSSASCSGTRPSRRTRGSRAAPGIRGRWRLRLDALRRQGPGARRRSAPPSPAPGSTASSTRCSTTSSTRACSSASGSASTERVAEWLTAATRGRRARRCHRPPLRAGRPACRDAASWFGRAAEQAQARYANDDADRRVPPGAAPRPARGRAGRIPLCEGLAETLMLQARYDESHDAAARHARGRPGGRRTCRARRWRSCCCRPRWDARAARARPSPRPRRRAVASSPSPTPTRPW